MDTLLPIILGNTAIAGVLALLALVAGRVLRRPAVAHALWLLVFIKLVTPPVWDVPVPWPGESASISMPPAQAEMQRVVDSGGAIEPSVAVAPLAEPPTGASAPLAAAAEPVVALAAEARMDASDSASPVDAARAWMAAACGAWMVGSVLFVAFAAVRIGRFNKRLRHAADAPEALSSRAAELAGRLGIRSCPALKILPGYLSPLLWFPGRRAIIVLPQSLVDELPAAQLDALLLHELAHLRRGDHWVRLIELAIGALVWWHPLFWLARRELHEVEELCCDAWVVWTRPEMAGDYARGLLTAIEHLSAAPAVLPATASGVGRLNRLQRRLTMILSNRVSRNVPAYGYGILLAAALALPLAPVIAQTGEPTPAQRAPSSDAASAKVDDAVTLAAQGLIAVAAGDSDQNVRAQAMASLTRFGADAVPALMEALQSMGAENRQIAQAVLQSMGWDAVPQFARLLESKDVPVRVVAAEAMMNIVERYVWPQGSPWAGDIPGQPVPVGYVAGPMGSYGGGVGAVYGPGMSPYGGGAVASASWLTDEQAKLAVTPLVKAVADESPAVRRAVVRALGALAANSAVVAFTNVDQISKDEQTGNYVIREYDPRTGAHRVRVVKSEQDALPSKLESPFAPLLTSIVPPLIAALKDSDTEVRRWAIRLLPPAQSKEAVSDLGQLLKDRSPDVRMAAATSLGRLGPDAAPALPALVDALKDETPQVRASAAAAIGALRQPKAAQPAPMQPTSNRRRLRPSDATPDFIFDDTGKVIGVAPGGKPAAAPDVEEQMRRLREVGP